MDFERAQAYLTSTINEHHSRREPYRLDRMRAFLRELGDPQNAYPTLHVGGTSGKGSTSTMLAAMLQASGKKVGLHTKPHVRSITERARIDGVAITEDRFAQLLEEMMPAIERMMQTEGRPSYYETTLALAFVYFAREQVDIAVIEVGIGGKLDGTNVITPEVSVITTVGYDHMDVLGDTLEEIAADKAGIAKPGVPLVSAVAYPSARRVIEQRCAQVGAPFFSVLDSVKIASIGDSMHATGDSGHVHGTQPQHFTVTTPLRTYTVDLPMLGGFQRTNAATAICAIEHMKTPVSQEAIEAGLRNVALAGRMEYFPGYPGVVFDIAHNPEKMSHLIEGLEQHFPGKSFHFVVAISESKDAREILRELARSSARKTFLFSSFEVAGKISLKPQRLANLIEEFGAWGRVIEDSVEALRIARHDAASEDVVVVTGSTFIVAELREWYVEQVAQASISV